MLRGIAMRNLGRNELALKHFANAAERDPSLAEPYLQIAAIKLKNRQPEEASSHVKLAYERNATMVNSTGWSAFLNPPSDTSSIETAALVSELPRVPDSFRSERRQDAR